MNINQRIFNELDKQGFSQASLANYLHTRTGTVSNWRTKNIVPSDRYVKKIAEFLHVSEEYLRTGGEDKNIISAPIANSAIVQGSHAQTLIVKNGKTEERQLDDQEVMLLKIFNELDTMGRVTLLYKANEIRENKK